MAGAVECGTSQGCRVGLEIGPILCGHLDLENVYKIPLCELQTRTGLCKVARFDCICLNSPNSLRNLPNLEDVTHENEKKHS